MCFDKKEQFAKGPHKKSNLGQITGIKEGFQDKVTEKLKF